MKFHSYDTVTGLLTGNSFSCSDHTVVPDEINGLSWHQSDGQIDHLSQKIDIDTGTIVDYQPEKPSDEHEWNTDVKRWALMPAVVAAKQARVAAIAEIAALEAKQPRAMREYALGDTTSVRRLKDIDDRIAVLRKQL
jgi:hypothetical protein